MAESDPEPSFGCARCWPQAPDAAWEARGSLKPSATLIDDSHLIVSIRGCSACGQQFVSVFLEFVDWADGDDPQYWTVMPLLEAEVSLLVGKDAPTVISTLNGLAPNRRCLRRDYPKGGPIRLSWGAGIRIVS